MFKEFVSVNGDKTPITILRDSGSLQITMIRVGITARQVTGKHVVLGSLQRTRYCPFLVKEHLDSDCYCGLDTVAILPELIIQGVDCIIGNDVAESNMGKPCLLVWQKRPETSAIM